MTDVNMILLKAWSNEGADYPVGQLLKVDEAGADHLIKEKIAEIYEPQADDVIMVNPEATGGFTKDEVTAMIKETIKEVSNKSGGARFSTATEDELDPKGGYGEFWQFARDIYKAGEGGRTMPTKLREWEGRVKTTGYLEEQEQSQGGFLVPTEFRNQILEVMIETAFIRPKATVVPMGTNSIKIPYVRDVSHASSTHGGIIIYRPDESGSITVSNATYGQIELSLHKLAGLVHVSSELLEDSPISMQPLLTRQFGEAIAWQEDEDFINGTGAGQALGILNAPCKVAVDKGSGQPATTIITQNITDMFARCHSRSQPKAYWLANNDTFGELMNLTRNVGTGGSSVGLVQTLPGSPAMTLLGRPLILTEHCQTLGTEGDIILADFSQYLIGQRGGGGAVKFASSIHLKFDYDLTSFRFVTRYDGQPWWPSALTPAHSSSTLSPFITTAVRE